MDQARFPPKAKHLITFLGAPLETWQYVGLFAAGKIPMAGKILPPFFFSHCRFSLISLTHYLGPRLIF